MTIWFIRCIWVVYTSHIPGFHHTSTFSWYTVGIQWSFPIFQGYTPVYQSQCILDAKYEKADLQSVVSANCTHLSLPDQNKLLELLTEYEELFDGTLGDWNTEPVSFELKEGAKPYHGRPFPVPKSRKETIMKELNRLCELEGWSFSLHQNGHHPPS